MQTEETRPLINRGQEPQKGAEQLWRTIFSVENRILFAGFLITLSFSFTPVPIFYAFHRMVCESFYDTHQPYDNPVDRCSRDEIAAETARQLSILGMTTTLCGRYAGTLNLFLTGWTAKRFGPRAALLVQTFVPAIRVATQILGIVSGKRLGIMIIQSTQLITIFGGPAGYILVVNIIMGATVEPTRRTAAFGLLQGWIMLAQGLGYLVGGMIGDAIGTRVPFEVAFVCFIVAGIYSSYAVPFIRPDYVAQGKSSRWSSGFLEPLKILFPQHLRHEDGKVTKHAGALILCVGVFFGVLATGYAPRLVQMYATARFDFSQTDNGWLMAEFAFMRSFFLILIYPRVINGGRRLQQGLAMLGSGLRIRPTTRDTPRESEQSGEAETNGDHLRASAKDNSKEDRGFDLIFLRCSLIVDGVLTTATALATRRWHIYLAGFFLPFGSGSAPAAKGVITYMCPESQRADALNTLTIVENIAKLATQGIFGFVFASLAEIGKAEATFFCNAGIAVVGAILLLFASFPPTGSVVILAHETPNI